MKKLLKKIKEKALSLKENLINSIIYFAYYHLSIKNNWVFIESKGGEDLAGNMLRIAQELVKPDYGRLKLIFHVNPPYKNKVEELLKTYGITSYKLVHHRISIGIAMERAKFLFTDADLQKYYVKRPGQILVNTWHGTPQKHMGRKNQSEKIGVGTLQRTNMVSDYLVYPSRYMGEVMMGDYMVANLSKAKILWEGYPRNSIFFDELRRKELTKQLGLRGKRIYVYMPTYRGIWWKKNKPEQQKMVAYYLSELDAKMTDDQVMLVKLHLYSGVKVDYSQYQHILPFPEGYETYDILNTADCLITDYSSVFFDFANTHRKIILFTYDEEEYFADRGVYFPLSELPFPNVKEVDALLKEMDSPREYDDQAFIEKFCTYDRPDAAQRLCRHVVLGQQVCIEGTLSNGKENVLVFAGALAKNGITTAVINLLKNVDKAKRNYYLVFRAADVRKTPERLDVIPEDMDFLVMDHSPFRTLVERQQSQKFSRSRDMDAIYPVRLKRLYSREFQSYYANADISHLVQFDGYGIDINLMYLLQPIHKVIVVHNDMCQEIRMKPGLQHGATLRLCYKGYDKVAVVSPDLITPTAKIAGTADNILTVNNYHNTEEICHNATLPIEFQPSTTIQCFRSGGIEEFIRGEGLHFVSIGRFSGEKNHFMLLDSFNRFWKEHPTATLLIIGGLGALYEKTASKARNLPCWKNVAIIRSIANPMPILKHCDLFILPSKYEGLPMTIKEADTLGIPVLTATITSVQCFAAKHGLYQVPTTVDGLYRGMVDFTLGRISIMGIDFEEYNRTAVAEFESLFE
ncbi:MAG: glycosyltransferase [Anaerotruncus sp.]|nr:glycosyltransferase [Anaerotruncus sp.]